MLNEFVDKVVVHKAEKKDRYWNTKVRELARRKKVLAAENERIDAELKEKREQMIQEFKDEVEAVGIENIPVIPTNVHTSAGTSAVNA